MQTANNRDVEIPNNFKETMEDIQKLHINIDYIDTDHLMERTCDIPTELLTGQCPTIEKRNFCERSTIPTDIGWGKLSGYFGNGTAYYYDEYNTDLFVREVCYSKECKPLMDDFRHWVKVNQSECTRDYYKHLLEKHNTTEIDPVWFDIPWEKYEEW